MPLVLALNISLTYLFFSCGSPLSLLLNKLYGYRKKGPGLTCISFASSSPLSPPYPNSAEIANWPHVRTRYNWYSLLLFSEWFSLFCFGGLFFLVEAESLLYLGDQHLGKQWIPVQKPTVKFCQTMKVFKGKIIQGKGQSLCYLPLCTDFLSVILNNFESVANLSTIRSFTSESTFFISWKISFLATWVRPHTMVY